ncbi:site-specific integrase [Microbispora sp. GKU 823]|uniref:site-specific integrase n=1 Tax=Microbispora sp. GKU 823 TaxID=1652100 RepID=UPI0021174D72
MRLFLARPGLSAGTVRSYDQTLARLCRHLGEDVPLRDVTSHRIAEVFATAWGTAAGATWNRHRAALRSFATWAAERGWGRADLAAPARPAARTPRPPPAPSTGRGWRACGSGRTSRCASARCGCCCTRARPRPSGRSRSTWNTSTCPACAAR